jgi:hypothetical protein
MKIDAIPVETGQRQVVRKLFQFALRLAAWFTREA